MSDSQFRSITGTLCTLEWERFCAFFPMVFRKPNLYARIYEDAISFSTKAKTAGTAGSTATGGNSLLYHMSLLIHISNFKHLKGRGLNRMFGKASASTSKSPVKTVTSPFKTSSIKGALNFNDPGICLLCSVHQRLTITITVPIYDATGNDKLNMNNLHFLHKELSVWKKGVENCICLVGYTANTYEKDSIQNLSLNIQWVVVLADLN
jgi:hypothetical protein